MTLYAQSVRRVTFSDLCDYFPSNTQEDNDLHYENETTELIIEASKPSPASEESTETVLSDVSDGIKSQIIDGNSVVEQPIPVQHEPEPKYLARLSEEEYKSAFYTPTEVQQMRLDACDQAAQYNRSVRLYVDPDKLIKAKSEARGLENSSYERDQHRSICIEAIVEGQKHVKRLNENCTKPKDKLKEDDYLALLSANCSKWARDLAEEDGKFDYEEAYGDEPWFPKDHRSKTPLEGKSKRGNRNKMTSFDHLPSVFALEHRPYPYYNYYDAILDAGRIQTPKKTSFWSKLCRRKNTSSHV